MFGGRSVTQIRSMTAAARAVVLGLAVGGASTNAAANGAVLGAA